MSFLSGTVACNWPMCFLKVKYYQREGQIIGELGHGTKMPLLPNITELKNYWVYGLGCNFSLIVVNTSLRVHYFYWRLLTMWPFVIAPPSAVQSTVCCYHPA